MFDGQRVRQPQIVGGDDTWNVERHRSALLSANGALTSRRGACRNPQEDVYKMIQIDTYCQVSSRMPFNIKYKMYSGARSTGQFNHCAIRYPALGPPNWRSH